jgi:hypothetical protein
MENETIRLGVETPVASDDSKRSHALSKKRLGFADGTMP